MARTGEARQARRGKTLQGEAMHGMDWQGTAGMEDVMARLHRLVHRWRLMRRASAVHRLRKLRERALASLEPVRTRRFEWADCDSVSRNGTEIRQRVRLNPMQAERLARFEWAPRRELLVRGWE